jgi:hypothetical protein
MANSIQGNKDHDMFPGTPFRHIINKQQVIPIYFEPVADVVLLDIILEDVIFPFVILPVILPDIIFPLV